jgi:hypothetical protein
MMTDDFLCLIQWRGFYFIKLFPRRCPLKIGSRGNGNAALFQRSCSLIFSPLVFSFSSSILPSAPFFLGDRGAVIIILKARDRRNPLWYYCNYRAYYAVIYGAHCVAAAALISPFCFGSRAPAYCPEGWITFVA